MLDPLPGARNMTMQNGSTRSPKLQQGLVMSAAILFLMGASSLFLVSQAQTKPPYDKATLIRGLKLNALDKKLSSQEFVQAIAQRGVDFQMTARDEGELRIAGASDDIIAVIRLSYRRVPKRLPKGTGSLTINSSMPDCKVLVNGQPRGTTDSNGVLILPPLKAGEYKILLRRQNYEDLAHTVQVTVGLESSESFAMTPLKGSLTVVTSIAGATVRVLDVDYPEAVTNLSILPGNYEVRVSKPGYKTVTRAVTIMPGQPFSLSVILEVMRVEEMLAQGMESLKQGNYSKAISIAREILASKPDEPKAHWLLGVGYFYSENYEAAVASLYKAISLGESVSIPVKHYHKIAGGFGGLYLCSGFLTLRKSTFEFHSSNKTGEDFSVGYDKLYELRPENPSTGRLHTKVGILKNKKEDKPNYNLYAPEADIRKVNFNGTLVDEVYCSNCEPKMDALYKLLQQLKQTPPL
jgi:tetratricopeptide (TPR) repeat protein